jgi:hypothetical protein
MEITSRSTGIFLAFRDAALPARPLTAIIQKRSDTNQDGNPQSLPGAFQPTAAMKAADLGGLTLPSPEFPPIQRRDIELVLDACEKECGRDVRSLVEDVLQANREAAAHAEPSSIRLLLDQVNTKGRWVRTFVVDLGEMQREAIEKLLVKPREVREFAFVTAEDAERARAFTPDEKIPLQEGGTGVPHNDIAGFPDDCEALKRVFQDR